MLTCKEFLQELTDYLDSAVDAELRRKLEAHINECPNCFVILDTTQKTIKVYKGMEPQEIPQEVHVRLMKAVERKIAAGKIAAVPKPGAPRLSAFGAYQRTGQLDRAGVEAAPQQFVPNLLYLAGIGREFHQHLCRPVIKLGIHGEVERSQSFQQIFQEFWFRGDRQTDEFALPPKQGGLGR